MESANVAGMGTGMKATLIGQFLIAGLVLTACGSTSAGNSESVAPSMGAQPSALSGMVKGSTLSNSLEDSAAPSTVESSASPSSSTATAVPSPSASLAAAKCPLKPGAMCDGADLTGMNLSGADLSGISLIGANLIGTDLSSANLSNARLTGANITSAVWAGADLTGATTGFDALDPSLQSAKTCRTRMANGVIDSRGCPCRNAGGSTAGTDPWMGSIGLGALANMPRGYAQAEGQILPINQNHALFALTGNTWGGNGRSDFALPQVTGPWAGVRTGANGDGTCLQWSVAINGMFAIAPVETAFPGEIYLSAVVSPIFRGSMTDAGARIDTTISSYLGKWFTAYAIPARWPASTGDTFFGELRLFTTSQPLPTPFVPANGTAISRDRQPALYELLGNALPLVVAPDGYQWAVATDGLYPTN
jgi:microcystin-dependent protein